MPEIERKLVEQMSEIEKDLVAKQDKKVAANREEDKKPDYSWWHYNDTRRTFAYRRMNSTLLSQVNKFLPHMADDLTNS